MGDDLGFDDPFFTTEDAGTKSKTSMRKEERLKNRQARAAAEAAKAEERARLSKVMADGDVDPAERLDHFDMKEILRAEKKKGKKGKRGKGQAQGQGVEDSKGLQEDFHMDVDDDRFKAVFDSHEFAIDPSNPKFKATGGMKQLLEEGRKKRKKAGGEGEDEEGRPKSNKKSKKIRR